MLDATQIGSAHTKIHSFQNLKYFLSWRHLPEHWRQALCCCQEVLLRYLLSLVSFCINIMWKMNTVNLVFIFSQKKNKKQNSLGEKNKSHSRNQANSCTCLSTPTTEGNPPPPAMLPDNCLCDLCFILKSKEYFGFTCDTSSLQPPPLL